MTADGLLILVTGAVIGFVLGYVTAWRFASKLEAHDVALADWNRPYDMQAPRDNVRRIG